MKQSALYVLRVFTMLTLLQTPPLLAQQGCGGVKQVMFVFDVSGGMKTNERLAEAKKFALRTLQERALENLLYKVISYGGNCNDVVVEVDWTRDMTVLSAGIKGLYAGGATPLASSVDLAIDEIKKSAYPEETQVCLMNNSANSCGSVKEILDKRLPEIPCVHFYAIGLELDEQESSASIDKANADLQMLAERTSGRFAPLTDIRELTGVAMKDTGFAISPVQFVPRKKVRALTLTQDSKPRVGNADSTQRASQTLASNNQAQPQAKQEQSPQTSNDAQSSVKTDTAKQSPNSPKETSTKETSSQAASSNTPEKQPSSTLAVTNTAPNSNAKTNNSAKTTKKSASSQKGKSMKADNVVGQDATPSSSEQSDAWQWKAVKQIEPKKQSTKKQSTKKSSTLAAKQAEKGTSTASNTQTPSTQAPSNQAPSPQSPPPVWLTVPDSVFVFMFYSKSTALLPESERNFLALLQQIKQQLGSKPGLQVTVEGHSSNEGSRIENLRLAVNRASSIAAQIRLKAGLQDTAVKWNAYGTLRPAFNELIPSERMKNRRVEVLIRW